MANLFAQAEALAFGKTRDEVRADGVPGRSWYRTARFEGNRPTPVLLADGSPRARSGSSSRSTSTRCSCRARSGESTRFDQWGVELGKVLAGRIASELTGADDPSPGAHDTSTSALIARYRARRVRGA